MVMWGQAALAPRGLLVVVWLYRESRVPGAAAVIEVIEYVIRKS